jgi:hypothetical protein
LPPISASALNALSNALPLFIGGCLAFRGLWILYQADQGRKHDMVYRSPVRGEDFRIGILIPITAPEEIQLLDDLAQCLHAQSYPHQSLRIVLLNQVGVAYEESIQQPFQKLQVRCISSNNSDPGAIQSLLRWGIQKILAQGDPPDLLTILQPGDLIKPDGLANMASVAYQHDVFQGYLAFRSEFEESLLSRSLGAQGRIRSRIQAVGRFHAGLGILFGTSGLAFKPNIAERFPIQYHPRSGFGEWSITLQRARIPVHWAANVVVFQREERPLVPHVAECLAHTYRVASKSVTRLLVLAPPRETEQRLALLQHNPLLVAFALFAISLLPMPEHRFAPEPWVWQVLGAAQCVLWFLQYRGARLSLKQWLNDSVAVLGAGFMAVTVSPLSLMFLFMRQVLPQRGPRPKNRRSQAIPEPVFAPPPESPHGSSVSVPHTTSRSPRSSLESLQANVKTTAQPESSSASSASTIPLLVEGRVHHSQLHVWIEPASALSPGLQYRLSLQANEEHVSTAWHPTLEHAYAELCNILGGFGIIPKTCGSCAYLYYPTAFQHMNEREQGLPQRAMCLWGQEGQPPNPDYHTALHVLSPHCEHHTDKSRHGDVVDAWQESLRHKV